MLILILVFYKNIRGRRRRRWIKKRGASAGDGSYNENHAQGSLRRLFRLRSGRYSDTVIRPATERNNVTTLETTTTNVESAVEGEPGQPGPRHFHSIRTSPAQAERPSTSKRTSQASASSQNSECNDGYLGLEEGHVHQNQPKTKEWQATGDPENNPPRPSHSIRTSPAQAERPRTSKRTSQASASSQNSECSDGYLVLEEGHVHQKEPKTKEWQAAGDPENNPPRPSHSIRISPTQAKRSSTSKRTSQASVLSQNSEGSDDYLVLEEGHVHQNQPKMKEWQAAGDPEDNPLAAASPQLYQNVPEQSEQTYLNNCLDTSPPIPAPSDQIYQNAPTTSEPWPEPLDRICPDASEASAPTPEPSDQIYQNVPEASASTPKLSDQTHQNALERSPSTPESSDQMYQNVPESSASSPKAHHKAKSSASTSRTLASRIASKLSSRLAQKIAKDHNAQALAVKSGMAVCNEEDPVNDEGTPRSLPSYDKTSRAVSAPTDNLHQNTANAAAATPHLYQDLGETEQLDYEHLLTSPEDQDNESLQE